MYGCFGYLIIEKRSLIKTAKAHFGELIKITLVGNWTKYHNWDKCNFDLKLQKKSLENISEPLFWILHSVGQSRTNVEVGFGPGMVQVEERKIWVHHSSVDLWTSLGGVF